MPSAPFRASSTMDSISRHWFSGWLGQNVAPTGSSPWRRTSARDGLERGIELAESRNKCDPPVRRDSPFSGGTRLSRPGFCKCLLAQTTRRRCAGTPNTVIPGSTLRITALPIPTVAPLPIEMRGTILAPGNTDARSPIDTPPPIDTSE